jgi:cobalt-zinc-cadmium efflux system protein
LKETILLFLQATPDDKQMNEVLNVLTSKAEVQDLHHFHIWSLDGEQSVMTVHLVLSQEVTVMQMKNLKIKLQKELEAFEFSHTTIELEFADEVCRDENTTNQH